MKNLIVLAFITFICYSCDPVSNMEAYIKNSTNQPLKVDFISSDDNLSKNLFIQSNKIEILKDGFDIGSSSIELSLMEFDSVVIRNQDNAILKIYKQTDTGKNVYNVEEYWILREPSKRFFEYVYEISEEDIE